MPIIRRENVRNGEPAPIRLLGHGALPGEPGADDLGQMPTGLDYEAREAYLHQWTESLRARQAELQQARAQAHAEASAAAERLAAEARQVGAAEGDKALATAREGAQAILRQAEEEGVAIRARAEAEGFQAGIRRAEEEMGALLRELRDSVEAVVDEAHHQRVNLIRNAEEQVVELALEAARRIAGHALRDDELYIRLLRSALARMLDKDWVRIRVSRSDLERVHGLEERLRQAVDGLDRVEVVEDARVDHGFLAETRHGTVDATAQGQMRELLAAIERALAAEAEDAGREGQP